MPPRTFSTARGPALKPLSLPSITKTATAAATAYDISIDENSRPGILNFINCYSSLVTRRPPRCRRRSVSGTSVRAGASATVLARPESCP